MNNNKNNKICKININNYEEQILNITKGLVVAYSETINMSREKLIELRGITQNYKKILENLLSPECSVKKSFIPNKKLIINLVNTITTLLNFIDKLMPQSKTSNSKNSKLKRIEDQQDKMRKELNQVLRSLDYSYRRRRRFKD